MKVLYWVIGVTAICGLVLAGWMLTHGAIL